jgi:uncharacterized membrane protein
MAENKETVDQLEARLDALVRTQIDFQREIMQIRAEIAAMRGAKPAPPPQQPQQPRPPFLEPKPSSQPSAPPRVSSELPPKWSAAPPPEAQQPRPGAPNVKQGPPGPDPALPGAGANQLPPNRPPVRETGAPDFGYAAKPFERAKPKEKSDIEKFIGENLLSKIAILLLIIGVGIGAKYAIDRGWITPVMRIAFGYGIGAMLLGLAFKLKKKYLNFSAVLLGGGVAIMYFITYFAYGLYELISQPFAFVLMLLFTVFTVAAAIIHGKQVIAHVGLVGAYAVPFLLSNDSSNFAFLFTYIAIINIGILTISVRKYWKPLIYTSFIFTWGTFYGWYLTKYDPELYFSLGLIFLGIFFAIFYLTTIIQHHLFAERTAADDLVLTLLNTGIFYALTASMIYVRQDSFAAVLTYAATFTAGILAASIRDYRRPLLYFSFFGSWLVFFVWFSSKYMPDRDFHLGLVFLGVFFSIFYLATILEHRFFADKTGLGDLVVTLLNTAVLYGICLAMLDARHDGYATMLTYVAAFTVGILALCVQDYRRPLLYASFIGSWLFYFVWFMTKYRADEHFSLAWTFLAFFFAVFYVAGLAHSYFFAEKAVAENVAPMLTNSFVFFGIGYALLYRRPEFQGYMGLFTVAHAALHFIVANVTSRIKAFPVEITYLLTVLVITFATIAVPVQFKGNQITLAWSVEAAMLFWFGRVKRIPLFEYLAYPLVILASLSLVVDWQHIANSRTLDGAGLYPLLNGYFVTGIVYVLAIAFINYINRDERYESPLPGDASKTIGAVIGTAALGALYNTFRIEVENYFHYRSMKTAVVREEGGVKIWDDDLNTFSRLWQINYTMLFLTLLSLANIRKIRSTRLGYANGLLNVATIGVFVTFGLYWLMELRESYKFQHEADLFARGPEHIIVRYCSYLLAALLFFATYRYTKQEFLHEQASPRSLTLGFDFVFYFSLWIIASSELINVMDLNGYNDSYKLGLSILWGIYALFLVVVGISFGKKHLRVGAIVLFALTLVKLFFYDITQLSTIAKTAVFVSLGALMLIVSFLYNKYKNLIFGYGEGPPP